MWISTAYAQASGGSGGGDGGFGLGGLGGILPIVLIFIVFYFLLIRPQQKRAKDHRMMIANVQRNDTVVTNGGIVGKVTKVTEGPEIEVEIAPDVRVKVERSMIAMVRGKDGAPAAGAAASQAPKK